MNTPGLEKHTEAAEDLVRSDLRRLRQYGKFNIDLEFMNDIDQKQNTPEMIALARARRRVTSRVKIWLGVGLIASLLMPIAAFVGSLLFPAGKVYFSAISLLYAYVDAIASERYVKDRMKFSAKLQEMFDIGLYRLSWNTFLVGARPRPEDIHDESDKPLSKDKEQSLLNWYTEDIRRLPIHQARLVAQRANLVYDANVRKHYRQLLAIVLVVVISALFTISIVLNLSIQAMILSGFVPFTPFVVWTIREWIRHGATRELTERLEKEADKLIERAKNQVPERDLESASRELQDAIYSHRASSPLVFDFIYSWLRRKSEANMVKGDATIVQEIIDANSAANIGATV